MQASSNKIKTVKTKQPRLHREEKARPDRAAIRNLKRGQ